MGPFCGKDSKIRQFLSDRDWSAVIYLLLIKYKRKSALACQHNGSDSFLIDRWAIAVMIVEVAGLAGKK